MICFNEAEILLYFYFIAPVGLKLSARQFCNNQILFLQTNLQKAFYSRWVVRNFPQNHKKTKKNFKRSECLRFEFKISVFTAAVFCPCDKFSTKDILILFVKLQRQIVLVFSFATKFISQPVKKFSFTLQVWKLNKMWLIFPASSSKTILKSVTDYITFSGFPSSLMIDFQIFFPPVWMTRTLTKAECNVIQYYYNVLTPVLHSWCSFYFQTENSGYCETFSSACFFVWIFTWILFK